jgi:hypothetical protein
MVSRGPAIWVTAVALALVKVGLATVIVGATGQRSFAPFWVSLLILVAGLAAAVWAVLLWREYLTGIRQR